MSEHWSYYNPVNLHFGAKSRAGLKKLVANKNILIVCSRRGRHQFENDPELDVDTAATITWIDSVQNNPDLQDLQSEINATRPTELDYVIGFGGGSAMDAAKVLSLALANALKNKDLLTLIKNPDVHASVKAIPAILIPTTSGTGSEVTPFSTVWDHSNKKKYSLAGAHIYAAHAFVDPELTYDLPLEPTIHTGLDAINQAAESIWNNNANPISLSHASRALKVGLSALQQLAIDQNDSKARRDMAECSVLAGSAISQTRTAICHSISYPLTAHFGIPHGLACAFTMSHVLKFNLSNGPADFTDRLRDLGLSDLEKRLEILDDSLRIAERAKAYVPNLEALLKIVPETMTPGRAGNNISNISFDDIRQILEGSWNKYRGEET